MTEPTQPFWSCEADELLSEIQSSRQGLRSREADDRAAKRGARVQSKRGSSAIPPHNAHHVAQVSAHVLVLVIISYLHIVGGDWPK